MPATVQSPADRPSRSASPGVSSLDDAVLLTLAYSDLFDYPLRADEVHANLVTPATADAVRQALGRLVPHAVSRLDDGLHCLAGREAIAAHRRQRRAANRIGWQTARRFARWLRHVPFVRSVAVCGSLAVDNAGTDGDVDLFVITAPGRLWTVQAITMVLRRLARRPGAPPLCPNYLLTEADLTVGPPNLYLAHEITQTRPLLGAEPYRAFRRANDWTRSFLPQRTGPQAADLAATDLAGGPDDEPRDQPVRRRLEKLLGGRLGALVEKAVYRAMLGYYRLRLRRHGWNRDDIAQAYRPDRQTVMTGGYQRAVAKRFVDRCDDVVAASGLAEQVFMHGFYSDERAAVSAGPGSDAARERADGDPLYAEIFDRHYGPAS